MKKAKLLQDATTVLTALGMPRAQQNNRSALTLLALLDLKPGRDSWAGTDNARLLRIVVSILQFIVPYFRRRSDCERVSSYLTTKKVGTNDADLAEFRMIRTEGCCQLSQRIVNL